MKYFTARRAHGGWTIHTWFPQILSNDFLQFAKGGLGRLAVKALERADVLQRQEVLQGSYVLADFDEQPAVQTAHLT